MLYCNLAFHYITGGLTPPVFGDGTKQKQKQFQKQIKDLLCTRLTNVLLDLQIPIKFCAVLFGEPDRDIPRCLTNK